MTVTVSLATTEPEELRRLAQIQGAAFADSPISRHIFGQVKKEDLATSSATRLKKAIEDSNQAVYKAVVDGQIVGLALWGLPGPHQMEAEEELSEEERLKKAKERFPPGTDYVLGDSYFRSIDLKIKEPHLHLSVLVVDPATQRTGAGSALLRWGTSFADKRGVDTYLEATEVGIRVYKKHGYHMFREPIAGGPNNEMVLHPMRRPGLIVKPASSSQLDRIAEIHRTAFAPTLWFNSLWGKVAESSFDSWYLKDVQRWMMKEKDHFLVAMRGEDILGIALWEEKEGPETPSEEQASMPEGTNLAVAHVFSRDMAKYTSSIPGRYWHLHLLAAHPPRTGAGRVLVQRGIDRAQKEGLPVYLEGGSEALPFYKTFGFEKCAPEIAGIDGSFADTPLVLHPLIVAPATAEDLPVLSSLHREAFWPSAHKRAMFSNVSHEDYEAWNLKRMQKWARPDLADRHWIAVAKRGDTILGFGHIEKGGDHHAEQVETDFASLPEGTDVESAKKLFETLEAAEKKIVGPYVMLQQLATSPRYQRTGAGKALMDWLIEKSHGLGLDLYLDSTVEGRRLYDSVGCEQWDPTIIFEYADGSKTETYPMVKRFPRPASSLPPLKLSAATLNDIPQLATIFREAFEPLEVFQYMFSRCTPEDYDDWNHKRMTRWITNEEAGAAGQARQENWTVVARRGDEIIGFGHWVLHGVKKQEGEEELSEIPLPEGTDMGRGRGFFDALEASEKKIEGEFYMLHQLATDPRHRHTGAARALCAFGIQLSQKGGRPFYLDAVEPARGLYDKLGFVAWDEPTSAGEGSPVTIPMVYKGVATE